MTFTTTFLFNIIDVSHLNITVAHPNGTKARVNQIGSWKLNDNLIIHDVLVVLRYHVSLLSISKLAKDNKLSVCFNEKDCVILVYFLKSQVGTRSEKDRLYFLNLGNKIYNSSIKSCHVSKCLWHNRLGHTADQVLSVLKDEIDLKGDFSSEPYDVCHMAKQIRELFLLSDHKSKMVGQLIYLDVWGPYKVGSKEGYRFFLTVVDDFLRAVWVFLLKGKDEVLFIIEVFCKMLKNQFNKIVKVFRSDNSGSKVTSDVNFDLLGSITAQGSVGNGGTTPEEEMNISEGDDLNIYDLDM
ncbi:ribonuclease H-like domain-containing protein [Tanacetum coccineum]